MVFEGDFVARRHPLVDEGEAGHRLQRRAVPDDQARPDSSGVEIGGDTLVTFRDTPAIKAFVNFLATAPAAEAWAKLGGFATGNNKVDGERVSGRDHPGDRRRRSRQAKTVVFDMSDEQPASFGGTAGQGEWGHLPGVPQEPEERRAGSSSSSRQPRRRRTRRASSG